jgi:ketosteroid isomerase-like protein
MARMILITLLFMAEITSFSQTGTDLSATIIALEKSALQKWNQGDPGGYLDISAADVVYFDPYTEQRLDGLESLKKYYEPIKGEARVSKYEMLNPKVQATSDMAVLTFNLYSYEGDRVVKWNCTEVYRRENGGYWKIIQTHWSFIKPELK